MKPHLFNHNSLSLDYEPRYIVLDVPAIYSTYFLILPKSLPNCVWINCIAVANILFSADTMHLANYISFVSFKVLKSVSVVFPTLPGSCKGYIKLL